MGANQQLARPMQEEQIRAAPNARRHASAAGDANAEHDICDDDAIGDYQSGERIRGRAICRPCAALEDEERHP